MTAIVEKNEDANQDASCHEGESKGDPVGILPLDRKNHQRPQNPVWTERIEELPT
jgi:hypothetical protein